MLRAIKDKNPDAFVGFTYPPDTILASKQAKEIGFNPKFFYASVGTAFPLYRNVMTPAGAEGVLGMGSWNAKTSPRRQGLLRRARQEVRQKEPDRWASGALLGRPGDPDSGGRPRSGLDRKAIRDYIANTEHNTIIGKIKFNGSENIGTPGTVSQWQNGEFEVVWPQDRRHRGADPASRPGSRPRSTAARAARCGARPSFACRHSMGAWLELIASGLITGGIYALVALGLNLQYGLMRILNIAHGEFLMLGAFLTWVAHTALGLLAAGDGAGVVRAADARSAWSIHRLCFRRLTAHLAQPRHLRGARPDGRLRPDVPGAELRLLGVGRRPARLRLPDRAGDASAARSSPPTSCWCSALALAVQRRADRAAAHDAARQGRARADAVAHRRAAGGHRHRSACTR